MKYQQNLVSIRALYNFCKFFLAHTVEIDEIRIQLGHGIVLGLEFFVAAGIIESVLKPTYYEIGILAFIVIVRMFSSYSLNNELQELHEKERHRQIK